MFRVDRVNRERVPCGMNSLIYYGASFSQARLAYSNAMTGINTWNQPDSSYGVALSQWQNDDFAILTHKGIMADDNAPATFTNSIGWN